MYGAVIGDIAGSKYEFIANRKIPKTILDKDCFYTDDTVMTVAVADALLNQKNITQTLKQYGRDYPGKGYGNSFGEWLVGKDTLPYFSFGNGAAMRVSAAAWMARTWSEAMYYATAVTMVTHNHPEGIKGAQATATAIYMAKNGYKKEDIRGYIETSFEYDLNFTCKSIRPFYQFDESCQNTVPQAIVAFLDSTSFDEAIKLAISLGGDADTIGAITGAIAEAYYGVPKNVLKKVRTFLPDEFIEILDKIN